jgi:hypothetical protein
MASAVFICGGRIPLPLDQTRLHTIRIHIQQVTLVFGGLDVKYVLKLALADQA